MKRFVYSKYEDVMLIRLNKLNQQGYLLKKTGRLFSFEKSDLRVKYNICYQKREDSLRYQYIGEYRKLHYYYTEDLNSCDLPCNLEIKKQVLLNQYHQGTTLIHTVFFLLFMSFALSTIVSSLRDMIDYYLEFPMFLFAVTVILVNVYTIFTLYSNSLRIDKIKNDNYFSWQFKNHDVFIHCMEFLIIFGTLAIVVQNFSMISFLLYIMSVIHFLIPPVQYKHMVNNRDFKWLMLILLISVRSATTTIYPSSEVITFPATDRATLSNQNYYIHRIVADELERTDEYITMPTLYYECRTEKAANAALKDAIHTFETISISNDLVDECYGIIREENPIMEIPVVNYVFRKGKLVVRFAELNSENVDNRIKEYIHYYEQNKSL